MKTTFILVLCGHILSDYYFQTKIIPENKKSICDNYISLKGYVTHISLYFIIQSIIVFTWFGLNLITFLVVLGISLFHVIINLLKIILTKKYNLDEKEYSIYLLVQLLHILIIFIVSVFMFKHNIGISEWIKKILQILCLENYDIIKLGIVALILGKPINMICKTITAKYYHDLLSDNNDKNNAGALIGILERLLIVVMLYEGEYSAIALIFTAKSIVRYNKITEDKKFGEYYLLGSFISVLSSLIVYHIVM